MKESGKERLKSTIYESTRAPLMRSPFPNGEGKSVAASPPFWLTVFPYRQPSPRGEGAPKGRIGHRRYEREWEGASQVDDLRKHPSAADAAPFPNGEGLGGAPLHVDFYKGRCPKVVFKSWVTSHNNDTSRPLETEVPQRDFRVWPNPKRRLACPLRRLPVRPNGPRRRRRIECFGEA